MLIAPPHQARDFQEEIRRIEWLRVLAADGAYDEALKLVIKPAEAAALKQMQSGDVEGGSRKLVEAISGNQRQSVAISGNQGASRKLVEAIRGNQWQSVTLGGNQGASRKLVEAISGNQWQSVTNRGNQGASRKLVDATAAITKTSEAIRGNQWQSVARTKDSAPAKTSVAEAPYRASVADAKPELSSDLAAPVHTITTTHPSHLMRVALAFVYTGVIEDAQLNLHATKLLGLCRDFGLTKLQELAEAS